MREVNANCSDVNEMSGTDSIWFLVVEFFFID
jgi:hypothetical protein